MNEALLSHCGSDSGPPSPRWVLLWGTSLRPPPIRSLIHSTMTSSVPGPLLKGGRGGDQDEGSERRVSSLRLLLVALSWHVTAWSISLHSERRSRGGQGAIFVVAMVSPCAACVQPTSWSPLRTCTLSCVLSTAGKHGAQHQAKHLAQGLAHSKRSTKAIFHHYSVSYFTESFQDTMEQLPEYPYFAGRETEVQRSEDISPGSHS